MPLGAREAGNTRQQDKQTDEGMGGFERCVAITGGDKSALLQNVIALRTAECRAQNLTVELVKPFRTGNLEFFF
jgi:hypothetical protein